MRRPLSNDDLDRCLRDVRVPDGLLQRLYRVPAAAEEIPVGPVEGELGEDESEPEGEWEGQLAAVPLPPGLLDRLHAELADEVLDDGLREVPVPRGSLTRWHRVAHQSPFSWRPMLLAAMLAFLMAGLYATGFYYLIDDALLSAAGVTELNVSSWEFAVEAGAARPVRLQASFENQAGQNQEGLESTDDPDWEGPTEFVAFQPGGPSGVAEDVAAMEGRFSAASFEPAAWQLSLLGSTRREPAALADLQRTLDSGMKPWQDVFTLRYDYLGYPSRPEAKLPDLEPPPESWGGGMELPDSPAFDRAFFLRHGHFPWSVPVLDPRLEQLSVPLCWESTSYELVEKMVRQGKVPRAEDVALDQWLAALAYRESETREGSAQKNSAQEGSMSWHWAGGPSPFGPRSAQLLQVVVDAPTQSQERSAAAHLTLLVDRSASMRGPGPLEWVHQAAVRLQPQFAPTDRLSCVVFNEEVTVLAESARDEQLHGILETLQEVEAHGGTDVAAALYHCVPLAMWAPEARVVRHLVVVTDGKLALPTELEQKLADFVALAASQGLTLTVVNVDPTGHADATWKNLVERAHGRLIPVQSAEQMYRALGGALLGQPPVAATDVRLSVRFDPRQVRAYRLIGGRPTLLGGLEPVTPGGEVLLGQTTSVLWELQLQPGTATDRIGTARLEWTDPHGTLQQRQLALSRDLFASSYEASAPAMQTAALVAEAGSILAGSPFAQSREHTLSRVLAQAERASLHLSGWEDYRDFLTLVKRLKQLGGDRGP